MSRYCKGCGAYIPDFAGVCLSCGRIQYPDERGKKEKQVEKPNNETDTTHQKEENSHYDWFQGNACLCNIIDKLFEESPDSNEERRKKSKWMLKEEYNGAVFQEPRVQGHKLKGCIDLRPLAYYDTCILLPGSIKELKHAHAEIESVVLIPEIIGRQIDGKIIRRNGAEVTIKIRGEIDM